MFSMFAVFLDNLYTQRGRNPALNHTAEVSENYCHVTQVQGNKRFSIPWSSVVSGQSSPQQYEVTCWRADMQLGKRLFLLMFWLESEQH